VSKVGSNAINDPACRAKHPGEDKALTAAIMPITLLNTISISLARLLAVVFDLLEAVDHQIRDLHLGQGLEAGAAGQIQWRTTAGFSGADPLDQPDTPCFGRLF
jgi:hypothetical protein